MTKFELYLDELELQKAIYIHNKKEQSTLNLQKIVISTFEEYFNLHPNIDISKMTHIIVCSIYNLKGLLSKKRSCFRLEKLTIDNTAYPLAFTEFDFSDMPISVKSLYYDAHHYYAKFSSKNRLDLFIKIT